MIHKFNHITDYLMTEDMAREAVSAEKINVTWYTNKSNVESVLHSHPYVEAILPISGEVLYSVRGRLYPLSAGSLIIFSDELFHSGKFNISGVTSERLLLKIDATLWHDTANSLNFPQPLPENRPFILDAHTVSTWDIKGLFTRISQTISELHPDLRAPMLSAQLCEFMLILKQNETHSALPSPTASSSLVEKAISYIHEHYTDPELTVSQLAEYTFVSRSHLSRVFKTYTMESIHNYIVNLRMQHCKTAIAEGVPVLEACTESGFSDYTSFLRAFRKRYGITPQEYKKRMITP